MADSIASTPVRPAALAKSACDYCRAKKLKCSREIPQCSRCKQWPRSTCEYNHERYGRKKRIPPSGATVDDRLNRIESSLGQLTGTLKGLGQLVESNIQSRPNAGSQSTMIESSAHDSEQSFTYKDPAQVLCSLSQINSDLEMLKSQISSVPAHLNGSASLNDLSEKLETVKFGSDKVREDVRSTKASGYLFYIPTKEEGMGLTRTFLDVIHAGRPLYMPPAEDLLEKIIYEPSTVADRGWIVLFNWLVFTGTPAGQDPRTISLRARLRWNTWLALDDSSLFLEPAVINIIALLTLATHGSDFATPNLSWILTGHASRLAQAINIHLFQFTSEEKEAQIQRLFLFWSLYTTDRSVGLAFGRPYIFAAPFYENIPLPEPEELEQFKPHLHQSRPSYYGPHFFIQSIHLAKLRGRVSDLLQSLGFLNRSVYLDKKWELHRDLSNWNTQTQQLLQSDRAIELQSCSEDEIKELDMGLENMKFQYHHLLVLLTRHHDADREACLHAARNAIWSLDKLVSTSSQVYNGIIWQLLYYPFTPFFVLFGNIIRDPLNPSAITDIKLLQATESYFMQMTSIGNMVGKLEKIANVFASLAGMYVAEAVEKAKVQNQQTPQREVNRVDAQMSTPSDDVEISTPLESSEPENNEFFNWLSTANISQQDMFETGESTQGLGTVNMDINPSDMFSSLTNGGVKRPLEYDFDWFSWDFSNR
ncbi:hypothetical protein F5884DRAFT_899619 [Xylogone sp. PMI_703]|nr:hypothetical protein F5884DRAFT_899619 [Xylogone sp. PMI_703]